MNNKYIEYKVRNNLGGITGTYVNTALFWKLYIVYNPDSLSKVGYLFNLNDIINVCISFSDNPVKIFFEISQLFAEWVQLRRLNNPE